MSLQPSCARQSLRNAIYDGGLEDLGVVLRRIVLVASCDDSGGDDGDDEDGQ